MPMTWTWKRECSTPGREVYRATSAGKFSTWNLTVIFDQEGAKAGQTKPWVAKIGVRTPQLPSGSNACAIAWEGRYFELESAKLEAQAMMYQMVLELVRAADGRQTVQEIVPETLPLPLTG